MTEAKIPARDLEELVDEWKETGVVEPYGMRWDLPAKELEELIEAHKNE